MFGILDRRRWNVSETELTPETVFRRRREFLRAAGFAGAGALALRCTGQSGVESLGGQRGDAAIRAALEAHPGKYPAKRNETFALDRPLTEAQAAGSYNNFYEFTNDKQRLLVEAQQLTLRPWTVEVGGLCDAPGTFDVDELVRTMPLEERLYRHRCVEAWAMAVPWTGFPLRALLERAQPQSAARYVRFVTFLRPEEAIGQRVDVHYPWPYYEALTLEEAGHELTLLATGIYGKPLPPQHGAPLRLVVPWKYGYKSIKSIVKIELVAKRPGTFWNDLQPAEYSFISNVDPTVPHPRWSQASERMLGTNERRPTLPYNGYEEWVAGLYA